MKTFSVFFLALVLVPSVVWAQQPTESGWPQPVNNDPSLGYTVFEQNELRMRDGKQTWRWDSESWYGGNINRAVFKTEGNFNIDSGKFEEAEWQVLVSHAISRFFNLQAGGRYESRPGPSRGSAVIGVEGLAPLYWKVGAYAYLGTQGRLAARFEGQYDLQMTQRLVLQPQFELNFNAQTDLARAQGAGLVELDSGLRLRYEITRQFAPYLGVTYTKKYGKTADVAASDGETADQLAFTVGLRFWF